MKNGGVHFMEHGCYYEISRSECEIASNLFRTKTDSLVEIYNTIRDLMLAGF